MSRNINYLKLNKFSTEFSDKFIELLKLLKKKNGQKIIALGGGNTPREYHREIVTRLQKNKLEDLLEGLVFTLTDERHVEFEHESSNSRMVFESFIKPLGIEKQFVFPRYHSQIYSFHKDFLNEYSELEASFKVALLGIGADCHTASLYPSQVRVSESMESVDIVEKGHDGLGRITLSEKELISFDLKWFISNSESKRSAFEQALVDESKNQPIKNISKENTTVFF